MSAGRKPALAWGARLLSAVPIAATALPLSKTGRGWVRIWDFPRVQIAALGALAYAAMRRWGGDGALDRAIKSSLLVSLFQQAHRIYPYTRFHEKQVLDAGDHRTERHIRLVVANVYMCNRRADELRQVLTGADPDVICLLEPDSWWEERMRPMEQYYPYTNKCPLDNTYGMLFYSRRPLSQTDTRYLIRKDVPSMRSVLRLASGDEIVLYCVHPRPPQPNSPSYGRDAELVLVGREAEREHRPAVVMGDLNDVAWSYTTKLFQKVSRTLDPRVGRGMYNTYHARHPLLRYPLDHFFHTREFTLVELKRLPNAGSDHFPMMIELSYHPKTMDEQHHPKMTAADRRQAHEMLRDVKEHELPEM